MKLIVPGIALVAALTMPAQNAYTPAQSAIQAELFAKAERSLQKAETVHANRVGAK